MGWNRENFPGVKSEEKGSGRWCDVLRIGERMEEFAEGVLLTERKGK